ncbi:MAG: tRNA 5-hydroxyuridine modification protein YegQ [Ferrovum sp.]|nr:tRNA 5-hydroxyuridine modification protein YegQ [Ferrovum sp.]NDU87194.1 tRNA 5-hydroxyuridine modification protein YegQ [Ferrovum sp.]
MTPAPRSPELLAPCGSLTMLQTALSFGADAVYAGQPRYSLRVRNNDFGRLETLNQGIELVHDAGKKFYLVSNLIPHNAKIRTFVADMTPVMALKPDALIMSDPGLMMLVREHWPEMPIHLSVQANTVNYASVRFWASMGIQRIILSRELDLDEIAEIRQQCPNMELEVFVHGALCIAYSGRCLLSGYFNHRDPNQGTCTNSCRWDYSVKSSDSGHSCQSAPRTDTEFFLEESQRPGQLMPIEEDEHGTYILNSKDLRALEHVQKLVEIGIDSLKIEGRTKSPYYVARTCQVYRQGIDDAVSGKALDPGLLRQLEGLANREYTGGFYERHPEQDYQNYLRGHSESSRSLYVGDVLGYEADGWARISVRNRFAVGDTVEVIHPNGNRDVLVSTMRSLEGESREVAPGSGHTVCIPLPEGYERAFLARYLDPQSEGVLRPS